MNKGQVMAHTDYYDQNSKGSCQRKYQLFSESLKHTGIGSRSVPLTGWQFSRLSSKNVISFVLFKIF